MPDKAGVERVPKKGSRRRLLAIVLAGMVLIGAVAGYRYFRFSLSEGKRPAGPAVSREAFSKPWTDRRVLLLGVGDSVTAGYGASPGKSYFDRLAANPPDEFEDMKGVNLRAVLPKLVVRNMSESGSISSEHLSVLRNKLERQPPDVLGIVVITTGGNDIIHNYGRTPPREGAMYGATIEQAKPWIANFERRLADMLSVLEDRFPGGCHVFIADIFDPTDEVGDVSGAGLPKWPAAMEVLGAYNDAIRRFCQGKPNVHLVPVHDGMLGHGIHCRQPWNKHYDKSDPHYWYFDNLEDPNDRGYDAIRRMFLNEMARAIPQAIRPGGRPVKTEDEAVALVLSLTEVAKWSRDVKAAKQRGVTLATMTQARPTAKGGKLSGEWLIDVVENHPDRIRSLGSFSIDANTGRISVSNSEGRFVPLEEWRKEQQ